MVMTVMMMMMRMRMMMYGADDEACFCLRPGWTPPPCAE
jgi:hypothetical protein